MLQININFTGFFLLSLVSYFVGFIYLMLIRHYDIYEKEPIKKLIFFSFLGGIVSISVASIFYFFIHPQQTFYDAIFLVGIIEEFAKLSSFLLLYKFIKKDFDEIVDGIIYMAALSLGFSVIENLFYAIESDYPYKLLALRFLTATIGHISFSIYMGIALYIHKKIHKNYLGIALSFILATLAHGLYDGVIFQPELNMFFIPVFIILVFLSYKLLKIAYAYSKMKKQFSIETFPKKGSESIDCCHCGGKEGVKYNFKNKTILICETCTHALIEVNTFKTLMKYYRPVSNYKQFTKDYFRPHNGFIDSHHQLFYHAKKQKINASPLDLKSWFEKENKRDLDLYHQKFIGKIFYYLGLRFL